MSKITKIALLVLMTVQVIAIHHHLRYLTASAEFDKANEEFIFTGTDKMIFPSIIKGAIQAAYEGGGWAAVTLAFFVPIASIIGFILVDIDRERGKP